MTTGIISTVEQLEALYGTPRDTSIRKEVGYLTPEYQELIHRSPFVALATAGEGGLDCSPKGDPAGFVQIIDEKTIRIPDRKGNNRLDGLRNIVEDPRVGLLFLIPGVGETLRVNGRAHLTTEPEICEAFEMRGRLPTVVIEVEVDAAYFHCSKAIIRSSLWTPDGWPDVSEAPTCGQIMESVTSGEIDGDEVDRSYPQRQLDNLY